MSLVAAAAAKAGVSENELRRVLSRYDVNLDNERTAERHRLVLTRIAFTGAKVHPDESREIAFDQRLGPGAWAVASDRNLTGKTSVISIAKWALRGERDNDLPDPVLGWLDHVIVAGSVDELPFSVSFDPRDSRGELTVGSVQTASSTRFFGVGEFKQVMSEFFESRLALPQIAWFQSEGDDGGRGAAHGWQAYVSAFWVSDAHEDLLFGETAFGSLPQRLLNVFVAVPWAPASFELLRASKLAAASRPSADPTVSTRAALAEELYARREVLRSAQTSRIDPAVAIEAAIVATSRWRAAEGDAARSQDDFDRLDQQRRNVGNDLTLARRQLAATRILTALEPSRCPRCSQAVSAEEASDESCYVCTRPLLNESAVSEEAIELLDFDHCAAKAAAEDALTRRDTAAAELAEATVALAAARGALPTTGDNTLETAIELARLDGAIEALEREFVPTPAGTSDDARILTEARKAVEKVRGDAFRARLASVNDRLAHVVVDLGFTNVDRAVLTASGGLDVTYTGGRTVNFARLAEGEKLRARLASVLAMVESDECRHPGLIVHDSIADTELNAQDLATLLRHLKAVAEQGGVQVIVTLADYSAAVAGFGESRVIGPATPAGHIF